VTLRAGKELGRVERGFLLKSRSVSHPYPLGVGGEECVTFNLGLCTPTSYLKVTPIYQAISLKKKEALRILDFFKKNKWARFFFWCRGRNIS